MKLCDIMRLDEAITIPPQVATQFYGIVAKWRKSILNTYGGDLTEIDNIIAGDFNTTEKWLSSLDRSFTKLLNGIIPNYIATDADKYKLRVSVSLVPNPKQGETNRKGAMGSSWSGRSGKFHNSMILELTPHDLLDIIQGNNDTIDELLSTIEHETTHLIQGLSSNKRMTHSKPIIPHKRAGVPTNDGKMDYTAEYWTNPIEIEAYVNGTISRLIQQSKKQNNPVEFLQDVLLDIKHGLMYDSNQMFNEIMFKYNTKTTNQQVNKGNIKAKKLFLKRLGQKIQEHITVLRK